MNCLRCGKEITEGSFCSDCYDSMSHYPLKPGIPLVIPSRKAYTASKNNAVRNQTILVDSEEMRSLNIKLGLYKTLWVLTLVLLVFFMIMYYQVKGQKAKLPTGQNYSTVTTVPTVPVLPTEKP